MSRKPLVFFGLVFSMPTYRLSVLCLLGVFLLTAGNSWARPIKTVVLAEDVDMSGPLNSTLDLPPLKVKGFKRVSFLVSTSAEPVILNVAATLAPAALSDLVVRASQGQCSAQVSTGTEFCSLAVIAPYMAIQLEKNSHPATSVSVLAILHK